MSRPYHIIFLQLLLLVTLATNIESQETRIGVLESMNWARNLLSCLADSVQSIYVQSPDYPTKCCKLPAFSQACEQPSSRSRPQWPRRRSGEALVMMKPLFGDRLIDYVTCTRQMIAFDGFGAQLPQICCRLSAFRERCRRSSSIPSI